MIVPRTTVFLLQVDLSFARTPCAAPEPWKICPLRGHRLPKPRHQHHHYKAGRLSSNSSSTHKLVAFAFQIRPSPDAEILEKAHPVTSLWLLNIYPRWPKTTPFVILWTTLLASQGTLCITTPMSIFSRDMLNDWISKTSGCSAVKKKQTSDYGSVGFILLVRFPEKGCKSSLPC